jgi:hypothetical protein
MSMTVKRYKIGFRVGIDGQLNHLWDGGEMVNLNEVLAAVQTLIDQLASNPEWRNGAVLAYNAISCSEKGKDCDATT